MAQGWLRAYGSGLMAQGSRLGVSLPVGLEQLRCVDVRVALSGAQAGVAEELLYRAKVGAGFQQVGRERVPQRMRADAVARAERGHVAAHELVHASRGQ